MFFCGNVMELVEKNKVLEDIEDFVKWEEFKDDYNIEVYIEKQILPEFTSQDLVVIDAAIGTAGGNKMGMLFLQKDSKKF